MFYRVLFIGLFLGCSNVRAMLLPNRIKQVTDSPKKPISYNFVWPFVIGAGSAVLGFWLWDRYPNSKVGPLVGISGVGFAYDVWCINQRNTQIKNEDKNKVYKIQRIKR